jgi:hypothetical protein
MQTTMLIDDAFLKLVGGQSFTYQNRAQFYCLAARAMRQLLVDEARRRTAVKRGGEAEPKPLDGQAEPIDPSSADPRTSSCSAFELRTSVAGAFCAPSSTRIPFRSSSEIRRALPG